MVEKTKSINAVDALAAGGKSLATSITSPIVTTLKAELSPIGAMSQSLNESPELMMGMSAIGDAFSAMKTSMSDSWSLRGQSNREENNTNTEVLEETRETNKTFLETFKNGWTSFTDTFKRSQPTATNTEEINDTNESGFKKVSKSIKKNFTSLIGYFKKEDTEEDREQAIQRSQSESGEEGEGKKTTIGQKIKGGMGKGLAGILKTFSWIFSIGKILLGLGIAAVLAANGPEIIEGFFNGLKNVIEWVAMFMKDPKKAIESLKESIKNIDWAGITEKTLNAMQTAWEDIIKPILTDIWKGMKEGFSKWIHDEKGNLDMSKVGLTAGAVTAMMAIFAPGLLTTLIGGAFGVLTTTAAALKWALPKGFSLIAKNPMWAAKFAGIASLLMAVSDASDAIDNHKDWNVNKFEAAIGGFFGGGAEGGAMNALKQAGKWGSIGALIGGPWGAAIGAILGAIAGVFGAEKIAKWTKGAKDAMTKTWDELTSAMGNMIDMLTAGLADLLPDKFLGFDLTEYKRRLKGTQEIHEGVGAENAQMSQEDKNTTQKERLKKQRTQELGGAGSETAVNKGDVVGIESQMTEIENKMAGMMQNNKHNTPEYKKLGANLNTLRAALKSKKDTSGIQEQFGGRNKEQSAEIKEKYEKMTAINPNIGKLFHVSGNAFKAAGADSIRMTSAYRSKEEQAIAMNDLSPEAFQKNYGKNIEGDVGKAGSKERKIATSKVLEKWASRHMVGKGFDLAWPNNIKSKEERGKLVSELGSTLAESGGSVWPEGNHLHINEGKGSVSTNDVTDFEKKMSTIPNKTDTPTLTTSQMQLNNTKEKAAEIKATNSSSQPVMVNAPQSTTTIDASSSANIGANANANYNPPTTNPNGS